MQSRVFRQISLERLSSPEQLDQIIRVTSPKSWLSLLALTILLITAVTWSILGRVPIEVSGSAIFLNSGGVKNIIPLHPGQITELYIQPGQFIEEGQVVAAMLLPGNTETTMIVSPFTGRILELKADTGSPVGPGIPLASLEFAGEGVTRELVMYVSAVDGERIQPGMVVKIAPHTVQVEEHGFLIGEVASVSNFPITQAGILRTLGSEDLIAALGVTQAPIEVRVTLQPDSTTHSGFQWSSSTGSAPKINSGTLAVAHIIIDNERPIDLVLPLK